jgi:hypothetical protein
MSSGGSGCDPRAALGTLAAAGGLAMSTTEAAAPDTVIDVHGLTKSFNGRAVVRDLSMQVKRGTIFGFLGPSGFAATPGAIHFPIMTDWSVIYNATRSNDGKCGDLIKPLELQLFSSQGQPWTGCQLSAQLSVISQRSRSSPARP